MSRSSTVPAVEMVWIGLVFSDPSMWITDLALTFKRSCKKNAASRFAFSVVCETCCLPKQKQEQIQELECKVQFKNECKYGFKNR